jgi:hypothetical protein
VRFQRGAEEGLGFALCFSSPFPTGARHSKTWRAWRGLRNIHVREILQNIIEVRLHLDESKVPLNEAESGPCCIRGSSAEPWKNLLPWAELTVFSLKRKLPPIQLEVVVTVR